MLRKCIPCKSSTAPSICWLCFGLAAEGFIGIICPWMCNAIKALDEC